MQSTTVEESVDVAGVVGQELMLDALPTRYGSYEHQQLQALEGTNSISWTAGATLTHQIPGNCVVNLAESYYEGTITAAGAPGAGVYTWMYGACLAMIRTLVMQPIGGQNMTIDQYHHFSKMVTPYLLSQVRASNLEVYNLIYPSRSTGAQNKMPASGNSASVPWDELAFAVPLDGGVANVVVSFNFRIPLWLFLGTFLSCPKDIKFGQNFQIQLVLEDPTSVIFTSTQVDNPSTGIAKSATTWTINNCYLQLAVEQDQGICRELDAKYQTGYELPIPFISKALQQAPGGSNQSTSLPVINRNQGQYLKRIYYALFNATESTAGLFLDNNNNSDMSNNANHGINYNRVATFQTMFDSKPRQQKFITASPQFYTATTALNGGTGDFNRQQEYLVGSCLYNSRVLGENWIYVDDFTQRQPRSEKDFKSEDWEKLQGAYIADGDHQWQFNSIQGSSAASSWNHYCYIEGLKMMKIMPGNIIIA